MEATQQYNLLTEGIREVLPLKAYPTRELVNIFRDKGHPINLKTELIITSVYNSGDISGIMCTLQLNDDNNLACALTHLIFSRQSPLYKELTEYQKKRVKRIKKLNRRGLN